MAIAKIHPTAIIDPSAQLDSSVEVGAYTVIGADVKIDAGTRIMNHVSISGPTTIGKNNQIFQFSSLGEIPQDKKYKGEPTLLEIGDNNTIREFCTFNRGTVQDKGTTKIGNDNWIMAYVHIALAPLSMVRIGIVAGEASGDLLGSHLIEALKKKRTDIEFVGIAGPKMLRQGAISLFPIERLSVRGYIEVLKHLWGLLKLRRQLLNHFLDQPLDLFIGIDARCNYLAKVRN